ncbi:M56 family metallopeptidase [Novosphingobium sp. Gsoil 351]|uniref:M56 family metallopeptidase n=1 Tax=Novosphingobium sp. Gsoil 351 TaxID=2675225 RepID=UPI0012B4A8C5|nr:M56 family metallopeptidase [Novosphingobium sp. Gsoil 351]QGN53829.1 hypothetical protein GKE62_04065 [Novosphingobium sp. Gsoil 351]
MIAGFASFLTDTLVWTGVLIAAVLVLRRPVARAFGPGMSYALWLLPLLRFALPPIPLPAGFAPAAPASVPAAAGAEVITVTLATPATPEVVIPWALLLTIAWLLGAVLFLVARWLEYRAMRRRLLTGAVEVDCREGVRIVESPAVDAPVALGVRDKVIVLPPRFLITGVLAERALAIEHELAHHRGKDLIANIVAQPLLALHWFNPLAWAAWNAMRRDQEAACDARAMAGCDARTRAAYARVIASFAAGERLGHGTALAAPMACPVLGDKSIVHRLRSLTMSDISPRRRSIGRWTLAAGAALALPLTATVVYAGQDAAAAPAAPTPPAAPAGVPTAPDEPRIEKHVMIMTKHADHDGKPGKMFERKIVKNGKTIVIRSDEPIDEKKLEAHLEHLDQLGEADVVAPVPPVPPVPGVPPAAPGTRREVRRMIMHDGQAHEGMALAMAFDGCKGGPTWANADFSHDLDSGSKKSLNRTRVVLCGKAGEAKAAALAGVRKARASIAANHDMPADVRRDVLEQLDETISEMQNEAAD